MLRLYVTVIVSVIKCSTKLKYIACSSGSGRTTKVDFRSVQVLGLCIVASGKPTHKFGCSSSIYLVDEVSETISLLREAVSKCFSNFEGKTFCTGPLTFDLSIIYGG